jgi:hypothetical protein
MELEYKVRVGVGSYEAAMEEKEEIIGQAKKDLS